MSRKFDGSSEVEGLSSYDTVSDKHGRRNGSLTSGALALPTDGDSVEERSDCSDYTTINDRRVLADQINEYTLDSLALPTIGGLGRVRSGTLNSRWPMAMSDMFGGIGSSLLWV
jgi:hypothetical protein